MKRILIMITAILLAALIVFPAGGEENSGLEHIAFLYFPTNNDTMVDSARYLVRTVSAGRANAFFRLGAVNSANLYDLAKLNDAVKGGTAWKGNITENVQAKVLDEIAKEVTELWLIIPEDDAATVFEQESLAGWVREVLNKEAVSATVCAVLIGDSTSLPGEETPFGKLTADFPDRMTCIQTASSFTDEETRDFSGKIHTGDYLIASRFGTPMDLKVSQDENGQRMISLPADTEVLLLLKETGDSSGISLKDGQGNHITIRTVMEIRSEVRRGTSFTCWKSDKIQQGTYYLDGAAHTSVKAYWYPDLTELQIQSNLPSPFKHGNNTVTFSLTEDYDRPDDFAVWYRYGFDDEEPVTASTVTYQEDAGWPVNISASTEKTRIQITPCVRLRMADGNLIYEGEGEKQEREIENIPVVLRDDAPKQFLLYLDTEKNQHGSYEFAWEDFLEYNKEDEAHSFEVHLDEGRNEIELKTNTNGFKLTAAAETAADQPVLLHLSCDGAEKCTLEIISEEIGTLINRSVRISSPQNGSTLKPNEQMTVEVQTDESLEEKLKEAGKQGISTVPRTAELRVTVSGQDGETRTLPVTGSENRMTVFTLENELEGEKKYPWTLTAGEGGRIWNEGNISLHLQNHRPAAVQTIEESVRIPLEGLIGSYEKVDLLEKALGTNSLKELFQDDETEVVSVKLIIEGIEGLELENGVAPTADGDRWIFDLKNHAPLQIMAGNPGDYQMTLTASDGVNESEPAVLRVRVYSTFIQILIYVGIGLAALLLLLIVFLIIRQIRKPAFDNIRIRCLAVSDENQEHSRELMNNSNPISLASFGKKSLSLQTALILTGQPPLSAEESAAARDIQMLPTRHDELNLQFGKTAMQAAGRQEKKEIVAQGNLCRIRMGKTNILVENVR